LFKTCRLVVIQTRATKLQKQLEYLQTNLNLKAVKLYSAAKYPANHIYKEYKLVVQPKSRIKISTNTIYKSPVPILDKYDSLPTNCKIENGQYTNNLNMQEKLQFYYVKSRPSRKTKTFDIKKNQIKHNVSSIDSLLLFSAKDSRAHVNLQSTQNEEKNQIQDAPDSILQPWCSSEIESPSSYLYAPTLGEVFFLIIYIYCFISLKSKLIYHIKISVIN
jgi:WAS family protein 1